MNKSNVQPSRLQGGVLRYRQGEAAAQGDYAVGTYGLALLLSRDLLASGDDVLYRVDNDWLMRD